MNQRTIVTLNAAQAAFPLEKFPRGSDKINTTAGTVELSLGLYTEELVKRGLIPDISATQLEEVRAIIHATASTMLVGQLSKRVRSYNVRSCVVPDRLLNALKLAQEDAESGGDRRDSNS